MLGEGVGRGEGACDGIFDGLNVGTLVGTCEMVGNKVGKLDGYEVGERSIWYRPAGQFRQPSASS